MQRPTPGRLAIPILIILPPYCLHRMDRLLCAPPQAHTHSGCLCTGGTRVLAADTRVLTSLQPLLGLRDGLPSWCWRLGGTHAETGIETDTQAEERALEGSGAWDSWRRSGSGAL